MPARDALDQLCGGIPGLEKVGERQWRLAGTSPVSFPSDGHATLAAVESRSYWFKHRNGVIVAAVRNFPPQGPIFDIGGGNGYVSLGLRAAGFDCVVVEPGAVGAANAAAWGLPVIAAPFQELRIPNDSLPAAGLFDVLEHIEDDAAALAGLHRILRPGGRLYLAVPAHQALWSQEDVIAGHFRRYNLKILRQRLARAGFTVEYETYYFAILLLPIYLLRVLLPKFQSRSATPAMQTARDHTMPSGFVGRLFRWAFQRELAGISEGRKLAIGASCLIVARK